MKYKKLLIILCSFVGAILFCTVLTFTLFRVKRVELSFKNQTTIYTSPQAFQDVITSAKIKTSTVFAVNKKQAEQNIEKNNPYIKVINIETKFPNKIIIHCAQREMLYYINSNNQYYYCDEDLKVLEDPTAYKLNTEQNVVELNNVVLNNPSVNKGDFLSLTAEDGLIKSLANTFAYNNKTVADIRGIIKSVEVGYAKDYYLKTNQAHLIFTTTQGFKIKIGLAKYNLIEKLNIMLALVPKCVDYYSTHMLIIELDPYNPTQNPYIHGEKLL